MSAAEFVDGSETPRRPAGESDGSLAQLGVGSGSFVARPAPPRAAVRGKDQASGVLVGSPEGRDAASSPFPEGASALSFQPRRRPRYTTKFCRACNARDRMHIDGRCCAEWSH